MQDRPLPVDLVSLAARFLREEVMPVTKGATNFQLRVAINALDIVARELRGAGETDVAEQARLTALLGRDGSLEDLNHALCDQIQSGATTLETPGLADHLWATTMAKLAVDQPNYAAYRRELKRETRAAPSPEKER